MKFFIPELSGFAGKELPKSEDYWEQFFNDIYATMEGKTLEPWILFGHGFGGAILLEFARRQWTFPNGYILKPKKAIIYGCGGTAFNGGFFAKIRRHKLLRGIGKWFLSTKLFQKKCERRLFQKPEDISQEVRDQFFQDIRSCAAYHLVFNLQSDEWRKEAHEAAWHQSFVFIFGEKDRQLPIKWASEWKRDFPKSDFVTFENWDHYAMLDEPEEFLKVFINKG